MAGSNRSRSLSWMVRHSRRSRAHTPVGDEGLQDNQHGLDLGKRRTKLLGNFGEIGAEISRLVDRIDQIVSDQTADWIGNRDSELLIEMADERRLGFDKCFEVVVAILAA